MYGVSHAGLDEAFDYVNFKAQLKDEDVKVDVLESKITFDKFKTNSDGMIPVIVQDYKTDKVLMLHI